MKHIRIAIVLCSIVLWAGLLAVRSEGGLGTTSGKEWHRWTEDGYSVIAAKVREVRPERPARADGAEIGGFVAVLEPLAVFAGSLDPSEHALMRVSMYVGGPGTSIDTPPKRGSTVLAVVQWDNFVVSDVCSFMPGRSALVEINGLGDPRVIETLKKLQDARAHADPDPTGPRRPTTQPAPRPK